MSLQPVTVIAPARLHMGFIDLSGALGRHFGSIGVALEQINTHVIVASASRLSLSGLASERVLKLTQQLCATLDVSDRLNIHVENSIPEHIGLGSGTQMALAVGMAISAFYDLGLTVRDIAVLTQRGARSGIGIGVFERGGLVVDGGRGANTQTPPLLVQMPFPEHWRLILVFDERGQGLHGEQEISAFQHLPPFPQQEAARLCYLLMMQGLPAVAEQDIAAFGEVITQLQQSVGEHFAAAQGGVFTSPEVSTAMAWLQQHGAVAIGQTSWGPTGFCAVSGVAQAEILLAQAQQQFADVAPLRFQVVAVQNTPARVFKTQA